MPSFITRVELHDADNGDYDSLHAEMTTRGFERQVLSASGTSYDLPSAMYSLSDPDLTAGAVRNLARDAAKTTGKRFWIFAAAYTSAAWVLHAAEDDS